MSQNPGIKVLLPRAHKACGRPRGWSHGTRWLQLACGFALTHTAEVQSRGAPCPHSHCYNSPLTGHERREPKIYEGEALCAFYLNSHPPGAPGQLPKGNSRRALPQPVPFRDTFPSSSEHRPFPSLCAPLGLTSAGAVGGDLFPQPLCGVFTEDVLFRESVSPRNNATFLRNLGLWGEKKKERKTHNHFR